MHLFFLFFLAAWLLLGRLLAATWLFLCAGARLPPGCFFAHGCPLLASTTWLQVVASQVAAKWQPSSS